MAAAAAIEIEMRKVREREDKVDQKLKTIAEMRKVREEQEHTIHTATATATRRKTNC